MKIDVNVYDSTILILNLYLSNSLSIPQIKIFGFYPFIHSFISSMLFLVKKPYFFLAKKTLLDRNYKTLLLKKKKTGIQN